MPRGVFASGTVDQFNIGTVATGYGLRYSNDYQKFATWFIPDTTGTTDEIHLWLFKGGSPSGNIWVCLHSDYPGSPGTELGCSSNVASSTITATYTSTDEITFSFSTPINTSNPNKYWIVLDGDYTISSTNYIGWGGTTSGCDATNGCPDYIWRMQNGTWGTTGSQYQNFIYEQYSVTTPTPTPTPPPTTPTASPSGQLGDIEYGSSSAQAWGESLQVQYMFYVCILFVAGFWLGQWAFRR